MKWMKQTMFIQRDENGVIVRFQENKPDGYKSTYELRNERASRGSADVEKKVTEYAKQKIAKKRLIMGD